MLSASSRTKGAGIGQLFISQRRSFRWIRSKAFYGRLSWKLSFSGCLKGHNEPEARWGEQWRAICHRTKASDEPKPDVSKQTKKPEMQFWVRSAKTNTKVKYLPTWVDFYWFAISRGSFTAFWQWTIYENCKEISSLRKVMFVLPSRVQPGLSGFFCSFSRLYGILIWILAITNPLNINNARRLKNQLFCCCDFETVGHSRFAFAKRVGGLLPSF